MHLALLERLQAAEQIDRSRASLDSASLPAPGGARKAGTKRHVVVDGRGIPLAIRQSANVHDSKMLEETVDAIPAIKGRRGRPRKRPVKLHADSAA